MNTFGPGTRRQQLIAGHDETDTWPPHDADVPTADRTEDAEVLRAQNAPAFEYLRTTRDVLAHPTDVLSR
jgi:hypothetical protein